MWRGLLIVFLALVVVSVVSVAEEEVRIYKFDIVAPWGTSHVIATTAKECPFCNGTIRVRAGTNVDETHKAKYSPLRSTGQSYRDLLIMPSASDPPIVVWTNSPDWCKDPEVTCVRELLLDEMAGDFEEKHDRDHGMD